MRAIAKCWSPAGRRAFFVTDVKAELREALNARDAALKKNPSVSHPPGRCTTDTPEPLAEKATGKSYPQSGHLARAKRKEEMPHSM